MGFLCLQIFLITGGASGLGLHVFLSQLLDLRYLVDARSGSIPFDAKRSLHRHFPIPEVGVVEDLAFFGLFEVQEGTSQIRVMFSSDSSQFF